MGEPKTIGDIIGNSLPTQTQSQSNLCDCGQPKKFDKGIRYPSCETCWQKRCEQER